MSKERILQVSSVSLSLTQNTDSLTDLDCQPKISMAGDSTDNSGVDPEQSAEATAGDGQQVDETMEDAPPADNSDAEGQNGSSDKDSDDKIEAVNGTDVDAEKNGSANGDSGDKNSESNAEDAASKVSEQPYSTRGRSTDNASNAGDAYERNVREALDDLGQQKATPATLGTSFLDTMSEEERRMRTRFIPDVEGMRALRKYEIKDDIALARSLVSGSGMTSLKKKKRPREDDMDVDDGRSASPSDDGSDIVDAGTTTIELPSRDLVIPNKAFAAPSNGEGTSKRGKEPMAPTVVEAVTAFNPPRPPESIGAKKKHRMLRWERRPEDVESDLSAYRKTVARTRQELHHAESEYERLETIDAHLRWHFLGHLNLLNEEYLRLSEEFNTIQKDCAEAADLLTARTRSRGAGKYTAFVMKDVLSVLTTKPADAAPMDTNANADSLSEALKPNSGIGGLGDIAFTDWDQSTVFTPRDPATAWVVKGDKVSTPYGDGEVLEVFGVAAPQLPELVEEESESEKDGGKKKKKSKAPVEDLTALASVKPPTVSVKLDFGVGFFPLQAIENKEDCASYSDAQLANRWKELIATAESVGCYPDVEGMTSILAAGSKLRASAGQSSDMDTTEDGGDSKLADAVEEVEDDIETPKSRFLPFGAGLIPTSLGHGGFVQDMKLSEIEKGLHKGLFDGEGVLGDVSYY
jgi:hypothetical protein